MQTEIEVKFLSIDHQAMRKKLQAAGGTCQVPMRLMRRTILDFPDLRLEKTNDGYVRVRDEGDRATLTYKQFGVELSINSAKEIETTVGDYATTIELLKAIGLEVKSEQETKRETWHLDDCEVVLDEWPWLKPYIEIEGESETALKAAAKKLGLNWADAVTGSVTVAYRAEYDIPREISVAKNPRMAFDEPVPDWMQKLRRAA
ncbi:MAG TPA: class IV adenylate cyclase [Candidatus Saccharimonas sp.]|nr:class IV adenylate cyclase [Candidatus Saccharimonas sp.]